MRRETKEMAAKVRERIEASTGKVWTGTERAWIQQFVAALRLDSR